MPIKMGEHSYGDPIVHGTMNNITVGKFCSIANTVEFDGGVQHNTRFVTTYPLWRIGAPENKQGMCKGDIVVGNDVWIGDGAMIMSGVTIGDGAVVGARAVVTEDVSPYAIVGGVPATFKKWRFPELCIEALLKIRWWDWDEAKIMEKSHWLLSENIWDFCRMHE